MSWACFEKQGPVIDMVVQEGLIDITKKYHSTPCMNWTVMGVVGEHGPAIDLRVKKAE